MTEAKTWAGHWSSDAGETGALPMSTDLVQCQAEPLQTHMWGEVVEGQEEEMEKDHRQMGLLEGRGPLRGEERYQED